MNTNTFFFTKQANLLRLLKTPFEPPPLSPSLRHFCSATVALEQPPPSPPQNPNSAAATELIQLLQSEESELIWNVIQVSGVKQTYHQFHHEDAPRIFNQQHLTPQVFVGRTIVGIPTILLVKFCSKVLAKWILPVVSNTLSIPIKLPAYVPSLNGSTNYKKSYNSKQSSYLQKLFALSKESFDVDTGIRFLQYVGLAWSVVDLVPSIFSRIGL